MKSLNAPPLRILLASQDQRLRTTVSEQLERAGFATLEAGKPRTAALYRRKFQPDLVLLELDFSRETTGPALCRQLLDPTQGAVLPLLLLARAQDLVLAQAAFDNGADDIMLLPVHPTLLAQRCRRLIESSRTLRSLRHRERILEHAERLAGMGSWEWDSQTGRLYVSKQFNRILGLPDHHVTRVRDVLQQLPETERRKIISHFQQADSKDKGTISLQHRVPVAGQPHRILRHEARFILHNERDYSVYGTIQDITEEAAHREQILYLAYYDSLTRLPNRVFFRCHLDYAMEQATDSRLAVMVLNLDLFARVNNSLGHGAGDELLQKVAERLTRVFADDQATRITPGAIDDQASPEPVSNKLARLDGDQFAILLRDFSTLDDVIRFAQNLLLQLTEPFSLAGNSVVLTASLGIALYPVNGLEPEALMRNAEAAMTHAKRQGRNRYQFYASDIDSKSKQRLAVENDLRHAVRQQALSLHFQPKLHLRSDTVHSVEALVRWQHPVRGAMSPSQFVPMAEETGLIHELGGWLINAACHQARSWNQAGLPPLRIAVNLSPVQIRSETLVATLRKGFLQHRIPPSQLEVEVTETVLLEDSERVLQTLQGIRKLGVRVALDDFGTGYSSLSYLTRFPFNTLKIDRSFVSQCLQRGQAAAVIHTIIQLCKNLNLEVVAEGVESYQELKFLRDHRCDAVQGHYLSAALDAGELARFIENRAWSPRLQGLN
ncbi:MAG: EAL domain-containing protein [Pseudomonadota bacterium]|nr:EAL domain-containing protein [Pseudomonadota bacterium]